MFFIKLQKIGKLNKFSNFSNEVFGLLTTNLVSTETIPLNCGIENWTKDVVNFDSLVITSCPLEADAPSVFCFLKLWGEFLKLNRIGLKRLVLRSHKFTCCKAPKQSSSVFRCTCQETRKSPFLHTYQAWLALAFLLVACVQRQNLYRSCASSQRSSSLQLLTSLSNLRGEQKRNIFRIQCIQGGDKAGNKTRAIKSLTLGNQSKTRAGQNANFNLILWKFVVTVRFNFARY